MNEEKKALSPRNIGEVLEKMQKEKYPDCEHWKHAISYSRIQANYFYKREARKRDSVLNIGVLLLVVM